MNILVVVPAYNEEESLASTMDEFLSTHTGCDYLIVNDGSTDATEQICQQRHYRHVTHFTNLGLAGGFRTGVRYALTHGYDGIIQFDSDGQHNPASIRPMIEMMERTSSDIVIGSRFVNNKKYHSARMAGSRLITGLIFLTTRQHISDPTSGLRLYNHRMMEEFANRYDFGPEPDSIAYLARHGAKVTEVSADMRERQAGESYLTFGRSISYMARICTSILLVQWFR